MKKKQAYKLKITLEQYIKNTHDNWSVLEDFGLEFWP
jgi:hypothetical protein